MKTLLTRSVFTLALWLAAAGSPAEAKQCYPVSYDRDGDGYADLRGLAADSAAFKSATTALVCPAGYVDKAGDRNDASAGVHPRRNEVGYNGIDDNSNGVIDEPTVYYAAEGVMNTTTSFRMLVYLNHPDVRAAAVAGTLRADIIYARLSNAENPTTISKRVVNDFGDSFAYARIDLSGLSSGTVYRAYVQFYRRNANGSYVPVGPNSAWYYTMTDSSTAKVHTRFQMVMKGLKELDESNWGRVGYLGTMQVNGTRYINNAAIKWCWYFYRWVSQNWLNGIDGVSNGVNDISDYFRGYGSFYDASEIPARAAPGDYLHLDTNEDGDINHAAMFLAYDTSQIPARVWSLEGNSGNEVKIVKRNADWDTATPKFRNLGYITNSMLD